MVFDIGRAEARRREKERSEAGGQRSEVGGQETGRGQREERASEPRVTLKSGKRESAVAEAMAGQERKS